MDSRLPLRGLPFSGVRVPKSMVTVVVVDVSALIMAGWVDDTMSSLFLKAAAYGEPRPCTRNAEALWQTLTQDSVERWPTADAREYELLVDR